MIFYSGPFSPVPREVAGLCAVRETGGPAFPSPGPNPDRLPIMSGRSGASVQSCLIFFRPVRGGNLIAEMIFSVKAFFTVQDDCPGGIHHIFFRGM